MIPYEKIKNEGDWTLFLDRDGTINKRLPGRYINDWNDFEFLSGSLESIKYFSGIFNRIVIVTNQQGISKELMTKEQLYVVHEEMKAAIIDAGGYIDQIYYCPHLEIHDPSCRKPNPGMAIQAASDFEDITFRKSLMVGDQLSDMDFGYRLKMYNVLVGNNHQQLSIENNEMIHVHLASLYELANYINAA